MPDLNEVGRERRKIEIFRREKMNSQDIGVISDATAVKFRERREETSKKNMQDLKEALKRLKPNCVD